MRHAAKGPSFHSWPLVTYLNGLVISNVRLQNTQLATTYMDIKDWITIAVAAATLVSSWAQFWVKERLFNPTTPSADPAIAAIRSKSGISFLAFTAAISVLAGWLLWGEVRSGEPLTRMGCFFIASLTVLTLLNVVLVHSLYVLRRLAILRAQVQDAHNIARNAQVLHWFG